MRKLTYYSIAFIAVIVLIFAVSRLAVAADTPTSLINTVKHYYAINQHKADRNYGENWFRVLIAFGVETSNTLTAYTAEEARQSEKIWRGWRPIRQELERLEEAAKQQQQVAQDEVVPSQISSQDQVVTNIYNTWGEWNTARVAYLPDTLPNTVSVSVVGIFYDVGPAGSKPERNAYWRGPITGVKAPHYGHLSNPEIELSFSSRYSSIRAKTTWENSYCNGCRTPYSFYGARVRDDGTFNSFPDRDHWHHSRNPTGFNGQFYGGAHEAVAGHIITPQIFGTYQARVE